YKLGRKKRKSISGASYHVMLRGNDGQDIYVDDLDRCKMSVKRQFMYFLEMDFGIIVLIVLPIGMFLRVIFRIISNNTEIK
ncbi:MAG: hypothetical protein ACI8RA_001107, partial [Chlamydiales bacterium]